jgi:vitamin B12 transporter
VTVFTAEEIERRDTPLVGELLGATPVSRSSGQAASQRDVAVRPRRREQLQQGVAGWHSAERTRRNVQLRNLTTDFVERVEVVRGAQSALFGTDAMASVVQVVSKRAPRGTPAPITAGVGRSGIV